MGRQAIWRIPAAIWFIVLLPLFLQWPALRGSYSPDPMVFVGATGATAHFRDGLPWLDPNVGFQAQALGKQSADQWLEGRVPWWNPFNGVGLPLAAEAQPASLFMPFVLAYHFRDGIVWVKLLLQIIAGLSTYALLRRMRLSELACATGGVLYEFNGTFAWHGAPIIGPIAFLPMLLLGTEQLLARVDDGRPGGWLLIPLALAWSIYAGFPETAYINGLFVGLWVLFRLPSLAPGRRAPYLAKLTVSVLMGLAMSLPQIVPFAEFASVGYLGGHDASFAHAALPKASLAVMLSPGLFGPLVLGDDPVVRDIWGSIGGYLTALQLAVALVATSLVPRRLIVAPMLWMLICVGKTYDIRPVSDLVNLIPLVKSAAFYRYSPPSWQFAGIFIISLGIDAIARRELPLQRHALAGFGAAGAITLFALWLAREPLATLWHQPIPAHRMGVALVWLLCSLGAGLVFSWRARLPIKRARWLALCLAADAVLTFALPMGSGARHIADQHPGIDFLRSQAGLSRIYSMGPIAPNYGGYFSLAQINHNYLPVSNDWVAYVQSELDPGSDPVTFLGGSNRAPGHGSAVDQLRANLAAYEDIGVEYVVTRPGIDPFTTSLVSPIKPSTQHAPINLVDGATATIHWNVPMDTQLHSIRGVSVNLGRGAVARHSMLKVKVCLVKGLCAQGHRELSEVVDNAPFKITFDEPLPTPAIINGEHTPLIISLSAVGVERPVALPVSDLISGNNGTMSVDGLPPGEGLSIGLIGDQVIDATKVYEGPDMSIYALKGTRPYVEAIDGHCTLSVFSRESVHADCATRATLLRRESSYPGWHAYVDGEPVELARSHSLFQALRLPAGSHDIRFAFRPSHYGAILAGFAAGVLAWLLGIARELVLAKRRIQQDKIPDPPDDESDHRINLTAEKASPFLA